MTHAQLLAAIDRVVAEHDFGRPLGRKTGKYYGYPYVPALRYANGSWEHAYATEDTPLCETREEAVGIAEAVIEARREWLRAALAKPLLGYMRKQYGLPENID